jgi:2-polyprenyl-3-methyl-5-hydroxy-6-metoxy-1,4-benzoquinol methylase
MPDFREVLYSKYFLTQSGRRITGQDSQMLKDQWNHLDKEVLPLIPGKKDLRILDIGCGFGAFLMLLLNKGYQSVEGIDISADQVEKAHELGLSQVYQADIFEFLGSGGQIFDVITGIDIIEHFSKDELLKLLFLIRNSLAPGGIAIFRTPNMDAPLTSTYAWGDYTHQCLLNYSSARQLFLAAGYSKVEVIGSYIHVNGGLKEFFRKICWGLLSFELKLILFASGKSSREVLFTPNLLIKIEKP